MKDSFKTIRLEISNDVATIVLNRPDIRNAFDERMIAEIHHAVDEVNSSGNIRAFVITGEGTAFSSGADVRWMKRMGKLGFEENYKDALCLARMLEAIATSPKPSIAKVNGPAIGGGTGLVAACDVAIASENAFFSFSEVKIGLVPACIGPYVIAKVGVGKSRELFISGQRISADESYKLGLVNHVATAEELDAKVNAMLNQFLSSGPEAVATAKKLVKESPAMTPEQYIEYTARMIAELRTSPEGQEGLRAFLEKRKPNWIE
ncbi:enoyl-CoA hydratase/isomerase family protein [Calditrichota bacterium]